MIGVVAHQRGEVERHGQSGLAPLQQELVAPVGVFRGPEPGELPHRPEAPAIHVGMDTARERVFTWQRLGRARIERGIGRFKDAAGNGGKVGVAPGGQRRHPGLPGLDLLTQPVDLRFAGGELFEQDFP